MDRRHEVDVIYLKVYNISHDWICETSGASFPGNFDGIHRAYFTKSYLSEKYPYYAYLAHNIYNFTYLYYDCVLLWYKGCLPEVIMHVVSRRGCPFVLNIPSFTIWRNHYTFEFGKIYHWYLTLFIHILKFHWEIGVRELNKWFIPQQVSVKV